MFGLAIPSKDEALSMATRAKANLARIKERAEATTEKIVHGAETVGASFGFGYLNGSKGTVQADGSKVYQIAGYDADLIAMVLGIGIGMTEALGKQSDHAFYLLGLGGAGSWASREGLLKGEAAATTATK